MEDSREVDDEDGTPSGEVKSMMSVASSKAESSFISSTAQGSEDFDNMFSSPASDAVSQESVGAGGRGETSSGDESTDSLENTSTPADKQQDVVQAADHVMSLAAHSWMTLRQCAEKRQFVCAAKPVHDFQSIRKCEAGWLGSILVPRCYLVQGQMVSHSEAVSTCRGWGGELALVDSEFFRNVTAMLLDRLVLLSGFESRVWVREPGDSAGATCSVMQAHGKGLQRTPCDTRLPFFCQKNASVPADRHGDPGAEADELSSPSLVVNMTSWSLQPLLCPLFNRTALLQDDLIVWYKDGQPIPSEHVYAGSPEQLDLNIQLLRKLGVKPSRMLQPALLQGQYWCRVWRSHPLRTITSRKIFVRFQDMVTLQGFVKTGQVLPAEAVFFNQMGDVTGLPGRIGRDMQSMSDSLRQDMQRRHAYLSDIITVPRHADPETDEVEFGTYLCLTTGNMAPREKGAVVDAFLTGLHTELIASQDSVRRRWNLTLPIDQAFRLHMTEMCPEARLTDKTTGQEATFPSTPVNGHTMSIDTCNDEAIGYAECRGDLVSGALWSSWQVDTACQDRDVTESQDSRAVPPPSPSAQVTPPERSGALVDPAPSPVTPKTGLQDIDEVHIEPENVGDVTERLAQLLSTSGDLTDVDVEIVADVIDRVARVPKLPTDVGLTLMQTVNKVLDSPLQSLQAAQRRAQTSTRILNHLDKLSEKLDFQGSDQLRFVMPNIAMEMWDMHSAAEPVIGLAMTMGKAEDSPLSEARIVTLSNRTWADLHLASFDVAIELPDQLVMGDASGGGRLSMAIYNKPGLFLSSVQQDYLAATSDGGGKSAGQLNSAIISASLSARSVTNLHDKVKLIFKPIKTGGDEQTRCVYWDFGLPQGGGWSSKGCVHNGTTSGRDICLCDHLTNFAILLDLYGDDHPIDQVHETALSIITVIGLSLSILGLALTIISFLFFKKLRQGRAQQTLFNMSVALLCSQVILLVGLKQTANYGLCLAVAVLLHYFILVSFVWMLIEAVLQYLTFVKVLGTYISMYTVKTVLPAWGIPLIPVISVLASDYTKYRGRKDYCWMDVDTFYYAFALPVGVVIVFNFVTFVVIMFSLLRRPEGLRSTKTKSNTAETNVKAAFTIFILLGLTWSFGYLAIEDARLPFQYLFTASSSMQGFLLFVLLVARRRQFRDQWLALCLRRGRGASSQRVAPTLSNSTSSNTSGGSFTSGSSSRSRSSSGGSCKTLHRADSNVSNDKGGSTQMSSSSRSTAGGSFR